MNSIIAIHTAIKQRIETIEHTIRMDKRMILSTLRTRMIIPITDTADTAILLTDHTQSPNRATNTTHNPIFMMIPEVREFCFIIFLSEFFIQYDIFFCVILSDRSFYVSWATRGIGILERQIFSQKYARLIRKRKISEKTARLQNMQS